MKREGVLKHMAKPFELRQAYKVRNEQVKAIEAMMKAQTLQKKDDAKAKRVEIQNRRMANEFKNVSYQAINTDKLKGMSKKQLRQVKKTVVNKSGQTELVGLYGAGAKKK